MAPAPGSCLISFQLFVGEPVGAYIKPCFRRSPKLADKFKVVKQQYFKGYDKQADTLFGALLEKIAD